VQVENGQATVRLMKNGKPETVKVETGLSSATQTEITAGLSEGETVVTSVVSSQRTNSQTQSVFGGFGGGGARFISR